MRVYEFVPDRLQFDMFFSTACLDLLLGVVHLPVLGVQQCGCDTAWFTLTLEFIILYSELIKQKRAWPCMCTL